MFRLIAIYVALKTISAVPFMLIRTRERAVLYVTALIAEAVLLIGGVYYLLAVRHAGLEGVLIAYVWSAGASALVLTAGMLWRVRWRFRITVAKRLLRFGAPLAMVGVALPILHVGDRYMLEWLSTTEELAVYGWAARLSGVLNMLVVQSFQLAFLVVGLKALGGTEGPALHRRAFRHYTIWTGYVVLGLSLLSHDATVLLASDNRYLAAAPQVLPLSLGFLAYGFYTISVNVIYARGRVYIVALSVTMAALVNIAINLFLIPRMGGMGAAIATLVAYAFLALVVSWAAQRHMRTTFPWRALATVLALVLLLWMAAMPALEWTTGVRLAWLALLIASYPVLVVLTGVYRRKEIAEAWSSFMRRG